MVSKNDAKNKFPLGSLVDFHKIALKKNEKSVEIANII